MVDRRRRRRRPVARGVKRLIDVVVASLTLLVLSPLLVLVAVAVLLFLGPPVIFSQERPGLHGVPFRIYKFRTMRQLRDGEQEGDSDARRLAWFGRFLRRTSLDELPSLINVVRGDMSLVGPRPLLMQYLSRYSPEQARRHEVKPGLTGWAQINGRNNLSWEEKFELDVWYVDNWSVALDIRILVMSPWKVIIGEGVTAPGQATTEFFGAGTAPPAADDDGPDVDEPGTELTA